ncbi:hypothetical protein [Thioflexithrix psekupsensis]|uniref:Uncharacterized protein n=1 Tax=Thioflexithrix psekupsensis TaxID=1570016 RepID=A0A251X9M9_9GAMM|nr:hypothetical protein [Thioflexithrix psekupsensis]OUD14504.1 hypothetical protein TPSD3_09405 [Thioflexithrix psekupsensis]
MNQLPLKPYFSMIFTRSAWPFWVIAVLLFLLWRSESPPAPSTVQHLPAPNVPRAVAGEYHAQPSAPQTSPYRPQSAPMWQDRHDVSRYRHDQPPPSTIWNSSGVPAPEGPRYRPLAPTNTELEPYHTQPVPGMPYYPEREFSSAHENWPSKPYMAQAGSSYHPPLRESVDHFAAVPPVYGYRPPAEPGGEMESTPSWSPGFRLSSPAVGAMPEPRHPYAPTPVWQAQPSGSYYRSEENRPQQPPPTWQSDSPMALP